MTATKPLPHPTDTSAPFWNALRERKVLIQRCGACGSWVFYPRHHCPHCLAADPTWVAVSGKGTLYAYTIARIPTLPEFADEAPQKLAVIALDEGVHINSTLVFVDEGDTVIGMRVRPIFDDRGGMTLLRFAPASYDGPTVIDAAPD